MDIFRKFAIRQAEVIRAFIKGIEINKHSRQVSVSIRSEEDPRAELRMILDRDELEETHRRLGDALAQLPAAEDAKAADRTAQAQSVTLPMGVLAALYEVGTSKLPHVYMGLCPDSLDGSDNRDDECPACKALIAAESIMRTAGGLPAHAPVQR